MENNTYVTADSFVKAHEGLWHMLKNISYKKAGTSVRLYENGVLIRTWSPKIYKEKTND